MIVRVNVSIQGSPGGREGYGDMQFVEQAEFNDSSFETVSKIFTRCHDLLDVIKQEARKKNG